MATEAGTLPLGTAVAASRVVALLSMPHVNQLTSRIIGAAIEVHRHFGAGLVESICVHALMCEFRAGGLSFERHKRIPVVYKGTPLGLHCQLDLVVEDTVVVEVKSVSQLAPVHRAQLITYLKVSKRPVGLLINFNVPVLRDGVVRVLNGPVESLR